MSRTGPHDRADFRATALASAAREAPMECDPAHLDPEALLREASFVRVLAAHLLRWDRDGVDDVMQDTMVSALESPPRAGFLLHQWLRGVVRHVVAMDRRARRRRRARELTVERPAPASDPAEIAMRYELVRLLVDEVHRLHEPYRTAILLRYFEGLEPTAIATRQQIPAATVRSRIKRGLDQLRERLDAKHDGDRSRWALALGPIAALPADAPARAALSTTGWLKVGLGLVAAGMMSALLLVPGLPWTTRQESRTTPGSIARDEIRRPPSPAPASGAVRTEVTAPPPAGANAANGDRSWSLRGKLVGLRQDLPWRTPLRVRPSYDVARTDRPALSWEIEVSPDGAFASNLSLDPEQRRQLVSLVLDANDPAYVRTLGLALVADERGAVPSGAASFTTLIDVAPAARTWGRVLDASGAPVPEAQLFAYPCDAQGKLQPICYTARANQDGRYDLRADRGGPFVLAATGREGGPGAALRAVLTAGVSCAQADLTLGPEASIDGRLLDAAGEPVSGVAVCAQLASAETTAPSDAIASVLSRLRHQRVQVVTDDDGAFVFSGLAPARHVLSAVAHGGWSCYAPADRARSAELSIDAPAHDIVLPFRFVRVELHVTAEGEDVMGAAIAIDDFSSRQYTNQHGIANLDLLPSHEYRLTIRKEGFEPTTAKLLVTDGMPTQQLAIALGERRPRTRVRLELADQGGQSVHRAWVCWRPASPSASAEQGEFLEASDGRFEELCLEAGPGELQVRPGADRMGSAGFFREERLALDLPAGAQIEQRVLIREAARLEVRAVDADGLGLGPRCVLRDALGDAVPVSWTRHLDSAWGTDDERLWWMGFATADPPLAAGRYTIELSLDGYATEIVPVDLTASRTTTVRVQMTRS
jgi:RNA polymerase sigma factor (sigma-70 family)